MMFDEDLKIELVKLNLAIFGAVISAMNFGVDYYEPHIVLGTLLVGVTGFLHYLSLLPEFAVLPSDSSREDVLKRDKRLNEWYIILGTSSYIFLIFGFSHPHIFPESTIGTALPFITVLALIIGWPVLLQQNPERDLSPMQGAILFGIFLIVGLLAVGVFEIL